MRFSRKKAQDPAPADPNLQVQPDASGAAVATKRRLSLPSIRLPGIYPIVVGLSVAIIAVTVGVCAVIAMGKPSLVEPLLAVDGCLAILTMVCCIIGSMNND